MKKYAAYCGTRNIYKDMETAAKSLIANSSVDKVFLLIEDPEFPTPLPDIIECIDVSGQTLFKPDGANMNAPYTYMAMIRSALCYFLPEDVHTVLSLDFDTFAVRNADAIWDIDLEGCYFASTPEWHRSKNGLIYCNHGVVLYNLDMMKTGKVDEIIYTLNKQYFRWVEQDAGNYLCQGRIAEMPGEFNSNEWTTKNECEKPVIIHYAGIPTPRWHDGNIPTRFRNMTWDEVMEKHERRCNESTTR